MKKSDLTMLAVHAHPDDESSKGAATFAKYADEGIRTVVVTCTGGERGDVLNPTVDPAEFEGRMAEARQEEMAEAAEIIGLSAHYWLGFEDSGLAEWGKPGSGLPDGCFASRPVEEPAERLAAIILEERPQVVVTYDEWGGYPHPDHVMTHKISMAALEMAEGDARVGESGSGGGGPQSSRKGGDAHRVAKVYYHIGFSRERLETLHAAALDAGLESPLGDWIERIKNMPQHEITTQIECAEWLEIRKKALLAHRSQVDPNGFWFQLSEEIVAKHWPYEDYTLVRSDVGMEIPESDLFAGLR